MISESLPQKQKQQPGDMKGRPQSVGWKSTLRCCVIVLLLTNSISFYYMSLPYLSSNLSMEETVISTNCEREAKKDAGSLSQVKLDSVISSKKAASVEIMVDNNNNTRVVERSNNNNNNNDDDHRMASTEHSLKRARVEFYPQIKLVEYPNDPTDCHPANPNKTDAQKVIFFADIIRGATKHIIIDGIMHSTRLHLYSRKINDPEAIWIVDINRHSCSSRLLPHIRNKWNNMKHKKQPWKIILMDYSDKGLLHFDDGKVWDDCLQKITHIFRSNKYVYIAIRSIVANRNLVDGYHKTKKKNDEDDDATLFGDLGHDIYFREHFIYRQKRNPFPMTACPIQHIKFTVRTDLVETITSLLQQNGNQTYERSKDVVHFWNDDKHMVVSSVLRNNVNQALNEFAAEHSNNNNNNNNYTITAAEVGKTDRKGRNSVAEDYAMALLQYKIVVVAQRDQWEDHYRLMEALAGGALVMTDPMHPLPAGLEHKKQLIVYQSLWELKGYLNYYLQHEDQRQRIAKSGHEVAMNQHRSWHLLERLVFGDWNQLYNTHVL